VVFKPWAKRNVGNNVLISCNKVGWKGVSFSLSGIRSYVVDKGKFKNRYSKNENARELSLFAKDILCEVKKIEKLTALDDKQTFEYNQAN